MYLWNNQCIFEGNVKWNYFRYNVKYGMNVIVVGIGKKLKGVCEFKKEQMYILVNNKEKNNVNVMAKYSRIVVTNIYYNYQ